MMRAKAKVVQLLGAPPTGKADVPLDTVFFALSDPIRRDILEQLEKGPKLVSELAEPFDVTLQSVSRHIQILVRAGLVRQERTGRISRCSLDVGPMFAAAVWVNRYTRYWETQFESLAAWLELLDAEKPRRAPAKSKKKARKKRS